MIYLIAGIVLFLGIHSVRAFAPSFRDAQVAQSPMRWKMIYSVISIAGFALLIWGYGQARQDNVFLYELPTWLKHVQFLLMIPAMILLVASQLPTGRIKKAVKNPMTLAVKIWAFSHLLVNGDLASVLLFGSFLAWAVLLVISAKKREQTFPASTSFVVDIVAVIGGIGLWVAFMLALHEWLIGVPVIA